MADYRSERIAPIKSSLSELFNMGRSAADRGRRPDIDPVSASLEELRSMGASKADPRYSASNSGNSVVVMAPSRNVGEAPFTGLGLPEPQPTPPPASTRDVSREIVYEDANGRRISPQSGGDFMSRRGAFTGPNNDPNTPGMTREYATEPALTAFNPDDARYAKRQADIAARESQAQIDLRRAIAEREDRESRAKIGNTAEDRNIAAEDRQRRIEQEDRMEAFKADQQRLIIENQRAEMERRAVWSQQHGGIPWSPQAEAEQIKKDENRSIADTHDMALRQLNAQEQMLNSDLDIIEKGGAPINPELIAAFEQITGKPFGKVPIGPPDVAMVRSAIMSELKREKEMANDRMRSLLGQVRVTRTEKQSEFDQ